LIVATKLTTKLIINNKQPFIMNTEKKYLGRVIKTELSFKVDGTFESLYAAQRWLHQNNYSYGSTSVNRTTGQPLPVPIQHGEYYTFAQKWNNISKEERLTVDGVIVSNDFREGETKVYLFNKVPNPAVSDTTGVQSSNAAG
jgi:hypothetical protein